jgi:hypothetical protein
MAAPVTENKPAALGAPDVRTLHIDPNAGVLAHNLNASPHNDKTRGIRGQSACDRVARVDVNRGLLQLASRRTRAGLGPTGCDDSLAT